MEGVLRKYLLTLEDATMTPSIIISSSRFLIVRVCRRWENRRKIFNLDLLDNRQNQGNENVEEVNFNTSTGM